jgi:hypothetical protein
MTMFTPALLLCLPLWAAASFLQTMQMAQMAQMTARPSRPASRDEACPTQWAAMPFVPPSVHTP